MSSCTSLTYPVDAREHKKMSSCTTLTYPVDVRKDSQVSSCTTLTYPVDAGKTARCPVVPLSLTLWMLENTRCPVATVWLTLWMLENTRCPIVTVWLTLWMLENTARCPVEPLWLTLWMLENTRCPVVTVWLTLWMLENTRCPVVPLWLTLCMLENTRCPAVPLWLTLWILENTRCPAVPLWLTLCMLGKTTRRRAQWDSPGSTYRRAPVRDTAAFDRDSVPVTASCASRLVSYWLTGRNTPAANQVLTCTLTQRLSAAWRLWIKPRIQHQQLTNRWLAKCSDPQPTIVQTLTYKMKRSNTNNWPTFDLHAHPGLGSGLAPVNDVAIQDQTI